MPGKPKLKHYRPKKKPLPDITLVRAL